MKTLKAFLVVAILITGFTASTFAQQRQQRLVSAAAMFIPPSGNVWQTLDMGISWFQHTQEISDRIRQSRKIENVEVSSSNFSVSPSVLESSVNRLSLAVHCNQTAPATVYVVDIKGVKTILWEGKMFQGKQTLIIETQKLASGVFSIVLEVGQQKEIEQILVLR